MENTIKYGSFAALLLLLLFAYLDYSKNKKGCNCGKVHEEEAANEPQINL